MVGQIRSQMTIILRKMPHKTLIISCGTYAKFKLLFTENGENTPQT